MNTSFKKLNLLLSPMLAMFRRAQRRVHTRARFWRVQFRRSPRARHIVTGALASGIAGVFVVNGWLFTCGFASCPSAAEIREWRPSEGGRVFDRKGVMLGQMESVRRENVPIDSVPQHVLDAFLVTEDRRFYEHDGIDFRSVLRATSRNIRSLSFREGFSTITMQLARNGFIEGGRNGSALRRKLLELRMARLLENTLTKDEILELYLNAIYMGGGVESMRVRAGLDGVLQALPLEVGQWVMPGMTLAVVAQPGRLEAVLRIPETQAKDVTLGQPVAVDTRNGIVQGRVARIDPAVQNGTVAVDVTLEGELPPGARPDLSIDGTIEVERLTDVLYVGRPAYGQEGGAIALFRLEPGGDVAHRVPVRLGRSSVNSIEVLDGLAAGDVVILSDMSNWDAHDRVRIR